MRNHNWPAKLAHFIENRRQRPFKWGEHDCCLFCADAAVTICGTDPAEDYRGKYHDEASAYQLLKEVGDNTIAGVWSRYFQEVPVAEIQRGDFALIESGQTSQYPESKVASVLSFGNQLWVIAPGDEGLRTLPISRAVQAWRVD